MSTTDPQYEAKKTGEAAEMEAKRASANVHSTAQQVREYARDTVRDTGRMAHDEANSRVSGMTDDAASEADRASRAASDAASEYEEGSLPARALDGVSSFLERTASGLRSTDLDTVVDDVSHYARRNPMTFLAGAAVLGFAATRIARAAPRAGAYEGDYEPYGSPDYGRDDPFGGPARPGQASGLSEASTPGTDDSAAPVRTGGGPVPGTETVRGPVK